jgi:hypothetical protein
MLCSVMYSAMYDRVGKFHLASLNSSSSKPKFQGHRLSGNLELSIPTSCILFDTCVSILPLFFLICALYSELLSLGVVTLVHSPVFDT